MADDKQIIDHLLGIVEKVTSALGQHKGHIELQNKDIAAQHDLLKEIMSKQDEAIKQHNDIITKQNAIEVKLTAIANDMSKIKERDESLRKVFIWATTLSATIGGGIGALIAFISKK